jgi:hypothetical protein
MNADEITPLLNGGYQVFAGKGQKRRVYLLYNKEAELIFKYGNLSIMPRLLTAKEFRDWRNNLP